MLQGSNQYIDYLQGGTANLQGGSPYLQGSSPNLQPQQPTVAPKAASPSATSSVTKTPSAQSYINDLSSRYGLSGGTVYDKSTNTGLSLDQFKASSGISNPNWSQLKFDTAYQPFQFQPQQQTQQISAPATPPSTPAASKPQSAYLEFLRKQFTSKDTEAAAKNVMELNKRTNEELLRARENEDRIRKNEIGQVESGLNYSLSENARLSNKSLADLALAKGYATDIYNQMLAAGATVFEAEREAERYQQQYGANILAQTAPALLAELETYKTPQQRDAYVRSKAAELGVSIDQVNSMLQSAIAAKQPKLMTLGEGEAVYDPVSGQFVIKNQKTFAPDTSNTFGNFNLTSGQQNLLNGIINKYNASPLVMAADRAAILENAIQAVKNKPNDGTLQLNLVYAYIQALDTYQSAVREGELGLVNSIDSKIGQLQGDVQKIQNGQIVRPEVAMNIANAAQNILNTIDSAAKQKAQSFRSQADVFGLGSVWDAYIGGFTPGYQQQGGQTLDDIINGALGFNSVGNTSASTGRTPYLNTLGSITGLNGSPLWKWGLDIDLKINQPVKTPVSGQVIAVAPNGGFGNQVKIRAPDGTEYWFSHLAKGLVKVGQKITKGAVIALGGNSGNTIPGKGGDGSHLDLTAKDRNGNYIPPSKIAQMLKQIYV